MAVLPLPLIFAALADVLMVAAMIGVPVFFVLRTLFLARTQQGGRPQAPQRQAPRRVPSQQQGQAPNEQKRLTDEVEEFLRRAAERRRGGQPRDVEIVRVETTTPARPRASQSPSEPAATSFGESDEERIGRESVSRHVAEHLDTAAYAARAAQLVKVDDADEQMAAHLSAVFDHQVGNLGQPSVGPATEDSSRPPDKAMSPVAASSIADLLASPASLRHAFVLQEILRRPAEPW